MGYFDSSLFIKCDQTNHQVRKNNLEDRND